MARAMARARAMRYRFTQTNFQRPPTILMSRWGVPVDSGGVMVTYFPVHAPRFWETCLPLGRALRADAGKFDLMHLHSLHMYHDRAGAAAAPRAGISLYCAARTAHWTRIFLSAGGRARQYSNGGFQKPRSRTGGGPALHDRRRNGGLQRPSRAIRMVSWCRTVWILMNSPICPKKALSGQNTPRSATARLSCFSAASTSKKASTCWPRHSARFWPPVMMPTW